MWLGPTLSLAVLCTIIGGSVHMPIGCMLVTTYTFRITSKDGARSQMHNTHEHAPAGVC